MPVLVPFSISMHFVLPTKFSQSTPLYSMPLLNLNQIMLQEMQVLFCSFLGNNFILVKRRPNRHLKPGCDQACCHLYILQHNPALQNTKSKYAKSKTNPLGRFQLTHHFKMNLILHHFQDHQVQILHLPYRFNLA